MGLIRFLVPERDRLANSAAERAYFSGLDEIPYRTRVQWTDEGLLVDRAECDSGNFHIPWRVNGLGEVMLSTSSLMEREQPYHLHVELARGTITRIRQQIANWNAAGIEAPPKAAECVAAAVQILARAACVKHQPDTAAAEAQKALSAAAEAVVALGPAFAEQALGVRQRQSGRVTTVLGANLGNSLLKKPVRDQIVRTFNSTTVPLPWAAIEAREGQRDWTLSDKQVEWSLRHNLKICGGPLLQLDRRGTPDWLYIWEDDEENLRSMVQEHICAVVTRYVGKVHLWNCAARFNVQDALSHGEEQRLRLAALAVAVTREIDSRTPVVVTIDQPWGHFMRSKPCDLSPLHFADLLVRAELGLSGIGLEINFGYDADGTDPRDLLDFSRHLDRWSCLGLPLLVMLSVPSSATADPRARVQAAPIDYPSGGLSPETQQAWIEQYLPVLLSKPNVQGIVWNQLLDSQPHDYAHGGLFDTSDEPKPAAMAIERMRDKYLG